MEVCCDESDEPELADELSDWLDVVEASEVFEFVDEFCDWVEEELPGWPDWFDPFEFVDEFCD